MSDSDKPQGRWSDEQIQQCWRAEISSRFEAENASYRASEQRDLDAITAKGELHNLPENMREPRNSFLFEIWKGSEVKQWSNVAEVLLPLGYSIGIGLIQMFEHTEAACGSVSVTAVLVDGEPRIMLYTVLVDSWSDERSSEWKAANPQPHERVRELLDWSDKKEAIEVSAWRALPEGAIGIVSPEPYHPCRVYGGTPCINPAFCASKDACCVGDPDCPIVRT